LLHPFVNIQPVAVATGIRKKSQEKFLKDHCRIKSLKGGGWEISEAAEQLLTHSVRRRRGDERSYLAGLKNRSEWLPGLDSNQRPCGYKFSLCFHKSWTISFPLPISVGKAELGASSRFNRDYFLSE